jgi:F-type H+-transporting ATPase subunit a
MKRLSLAIGAIFLLLPASASAAGEEFDPSVEFEQHSWIPIHLGPLDLSITKAVAYLLLGTVLTILIGVGLMRWRLGIEPDRRQAVGEMVYEIAQTQIAEQGLPAKAIGRWFPYVASLFLFIWTLNILGFVPLPLSDETVTVFGVELPTLGIYAATSSISVTLALALMTFAFTHVEGIRANGPIRYFKSWVPEVPKPMVPFIAVLEVLGQFMRLISLSVRLFANMLAGHILILTFIGLIFVIGNIALAPLSVAVGTIFYLFEVVIVVSIQAYIFAALSAIYIGSAIEPEH